MIYLVDKSAWEQLRYSDAARQSMITRFLDGSIATCPVIAAEMCFSARNHAELTAMRTEYETVLWLETSDAAQRRMLDVMQLLALRGHHRSVGIPDLLVAATAEAHGATILHYDSDFERIADVTGQAHEWIVPRGSGHADTRRA
ncbi:ribonuclease VapC [Catellatospora sp. TT07R-123]|uniref:PIN domain nuclease n=1 Tax=Catellatospora sp. TT07R-123 TaxID=2733863 RepID=UPI001AFD8075|nr:PIN domain nuclease [Catellatospora sp. TT07R-123]GHJ45789.1 ribonuclease VapC [Catellatospora sp. TT07R-123]